MCQERRLYGNVWARAGVALPVLVPWGWSRRTAEVSMPGSSPIINLTVTPKGDVAMQRLIAVRVQCVTAG